VIRRALHPQLRELWTHPPLDSHAEGWLSDDPDPNELSVVTHVGAFRCAPLVCEPLKLFAELDVVLLRPTTPGALIRQGGDIDNQLKTLFDALRSLITSVSCRTMTSRARTRIRFTACWTTTSGSFAWRSRWTDTSPLRIRGA
jgi:hypothetical protein